MNFSIFWPNQKIREKINNYFQRHSLYFYALHYVYVSAASRQYLEFGFWALLGRISKIVKVKSFYNYLTNHLPRSQNFQFFWDTLNCTYIQLTINDIIELFFRVVPSANINNSGWIVLIFQDRNSVRYSVQSSRLKAKNHVAIKNPNCGHQGHSERFVKWGKGHRISG